MIRALPIRNQFPCHTAINGNFVLGMTCFPNTRQSYDGHKLIEYKLPSGNWLPFPNTNMHTECVGKDKVTDTVSTSLDPRPHFHQGSGPGIDCLRMR